MSSDDFISADLKERSLVHDQLKEIYAMRSRLVHGDGRTGATDVAEKTRIVRELTARGLLKAVRDEVPDAAYFRRAMLAGPTPAT